MNTVFHVRINGGPEKTIALPSGLYDVAVAASLALATEEQAHGHMQVEIWVPKLLPDYGPYHYRALRNEYGNLEIRPDLRIGRAHKRYASVHEAMEAAEKR